MVKNRLIDWALIGVTIFSAVLIVTRVFEKNTIEVTEPPAEPIEVARPLEVNTLTILPEPKQNPFAGAEAADKNWSELMGDSFLKGSRVQVSKGCGAAVSRSEWGIATLNQVVSEQLVSGKRSIFFGFRINPCFRIGQTVHALKFGERPEEPIVKYLTSAKIDSILSMPFDKIPKKFFDTVRFPKDRFPRAFANESQTEPDETIIHLSDFFAAAPQASLLPPQLIRGHVFGNVELKSFLSTNPHAVLVDTRSPEEFSKGTLGSSLNIPYFPAPGLASFSWQHTIGQMSASRFNAASLLELKQKSVVLFGAHSRDPRPFYVAFELYRLGFERIAWVYDGYEGN